MASKAKAHSMNFKHFTSDLLVGRCALTAGELDFTIKYDTCLRRGFGGQVKYRLGRDAEEEE
jgi:hypothetical protein